MIRYSLKCEAGHGFESWFQNADGFAALQTLGQVACPVCGSVSVDKSLMAPSVQPARKASAAVPGGKASPGPLTAPGTDLEAAIATLRKNIEENSDYVGMNFASEARKMHDGETPSRPIHGEARPDEARAMIEDGLPVAPLPFLPARKVN